MKTLKIVLALAAVVGFVALTIGVSFAHYTGAPPGTTTGQIHDTVGEDWWIKMREHMEARWYGIEDETWYDEMHDQEWFNEMLEYMEERGYYHHRYNNYDENHYYDNYYGYGSYGRRGFGCWGR